MFVILLSNWYISLSSTWIYENYLFRNDVMDFCWYFKWKHFWVEAMIIYRGFQFLPLSSYKLFFSIKFYSMCSLGFLKPHQKTTCITNFHFEYCIIILHTESRSCDGYWIFRKFLSLDGMSYDSMMKEREGTLVCMLEESRFLSDWDLFGSNYFHLVTPKCRWDTMITPSCTVLSLPRDCS